MQNENQIENKKQKRIGMKRGNIMMKQRIWNVLCEDESLKKRLIKSYKLISVKYPVRPADGIIVLGVVGFYALVLAFWKNLLSESERTNYPYKYHSLRFWAFFPWMYERQPRDPFLYKPNDQNLRDVEMYDEYKTNKDKILFKKTQQYNSVLLSLRERMVPCLDHRELDITEFQTLIKLNSDKTALNMLKKSINAECVTRGMMKDERLYLKEMIDIDYKTSEYKYKDDLYKELSELIKID